MSANSPEIGNFTIFNKKKTNPAIEIMYLCSIVIH